MSRSKKINVAEDLMESLLKEVNEKPPRELLGLSDLDNYDKVEDNSPQGYLVSSSDEVLDSTDIGYESTTAQPPKPHNSSPSDDLPDLVLNDEGMNPSLASLFDSAPLVLDKPIEYKPKKQNPEPVVEKAEAPKFEKNENKPNKNFTTVDLSSEVSVADAERTLALGGTSTMPAEERPLFPSGPAASPSNEVNNFFAAKAEKEKDFNSDKTVAVTGFQNIKIENHDDKVKVSIGQNRSAYSTGYQSWGGGAEASLGQAENLRIAQEKILELERENEKLRSQNDELISASDIIRERSDLLTAQVSEFKNDKEGLEESFKNEVALLKGHLQRKEVEMQKAQIKVDDLESRLKFDMKKIRIRERELENRLELIRAEKNAITKSKDEQILDLRRKMDVLQMEVDSYRQKCVELNKLLENNQDSFKRTTRALRLAMANLELQEENKVAVNVALKKVD